MKKKDAQTNSLEPETRTVLMTFIFSRNLDLKTEGWGCDMSPGSQTCKQLFTQSVLNQDLCTGHPYRYWSMWTLDLNSVLVPIRHVLRTSTFPLQHYTRLLFTGSVGGLRIKLQRQQKLEIEETLGFLNHYSGKYPNEVILQLFLWEWHLFPFFTFFPIAVCLQKHVICMEKDWIYWEGMISMCLWSTSTSPSYVSSRCALT